MDRLLSRREVAARLGVSVRTVSRWTTAGILPSVRLGRLSRVPEEGLDRFIADRLRPAREEAPR